MDIIRIITDKAHPGDLNMALDEAVLVGVNESSSPPTLRFYQWERPTISLGYFQKISEIALQDETIRQMPVVRRQTGGGAILHHDELTYSLVLPLSQADGLTDIENLYQAVHDAFIRVLGKWQITARYRGGHDRGNSRRGPFFCFARQHRLDLVVGREKILGSAQRRMKNAVLQHGSLILGRHFQQQPSAEVRPAAAGDFSLGAFMNEAAESICRSLHLSGEEGDFSAAELERARQLCDKYRNPQWNRKS